MLAVEAPFPHPGATAFLRPSGEEVRILQRRADGGVTIAVADRFKRASSTRTVPLADLAPTREQALPQPARRKRRA